MARRLAVRGAARLSSTARSARSRLGAAIPDLRGAGIRGAREGGGDGGSATGSGAVGGATGGESTVVWTTGAGGAGGGGTLETLWGGGGVSGSEGRPDRGPGKSPPGTHPPGRGGSRRPLPRRCRPHT